MRAGVRGFLMGISIGFLAILLAGTMVTRNLATEGTYAQLKLFNEVLSLIRSSYVDEPQTDNLIKGAYEGLLSELDPFSEYMTAEEYARFAAAGGDDAAGNRVAARNADAGIRVIKKEGIVLVIAVRSDSDAEAKGITPGDHVRRIGDHPVREMSLADVELALTGPPGATVALSLLRREEPRKLDAEVLMKEPPRPAATLEVADSKEGIGVLRIQHFGPGISTEVSSLLDRAGRQRLRKLLLDLRGNAWGTMDEAARTAGLFVGDTVVARLAGRDGATTDIPSHRARAAWSGQAAVLIDSGTAEAAELFAAALHDGRSAQLLGENSFGVGAQQESLPLKNGAWIRLSVRKYVSTSGTSWHGTGLKPDHAITVAQDMTRPADRQKEQLRQAIDYFRGPGTAPAAL